MKRIEKEKWDADLTESSSSFDSDGTSFSDAEVDSELFDDALSAFPFDGYSGLFQMKKKKMRSNWKKYTGPLRWRCKWVELQIKRFEAQAQKYEREIAEYNRRKQLESCKLGNVNSESLPDSAQSLKKAVLKRKKRRRAEDTDDISSFMCQHNLFSYFENKKSSAGAPCSDGNWGKQGVGAEKLSSDIDEIGVNEELIPHEFEDESNSLGHVFWKIGEMQGKVSAMKTRVHKVLSENASRFPLNENLSLLVPCNNSLTSSAENPASPLNEGEISGTASPIAGEIVYDDSDTKMVDVAMSESAHLGLGEVNHVPENIKSVNPPAVGGSSGNPSGTILMYNRRAKRNSNKSKEVNIVSTQMPQGSTEQQGSSPLVPSDQVPEPSSPNICSIPKMMTASTPGTTSFKRKRAMRKAGSGKWKQ